MADTYFEDGTQKTALGGDEAIPMTFTPGGTPVDAYVTPDDLFKNYMYLHKLYVTITANDLNVGIKDLAGDDASATNPIRVRIGNVEHTLTAALTVTAADGTNWFNAGSSELATKAVGLFVYLGYNATDGVVIGFSRIPYAQTYSDFSAVTTNEAFCKISDISNASASDAYQNIGYFEAVLSAGAGYTWSGLANAIEGKTLISNWLTWVPATTASGSLTYTSVTNNWATYRFVDKRLEGELRQTGTLGGSADTVILNTLPFSSLNAPTANVGAGCGQTASGLAAVVAVTNGAPDQLTITKYDQSNYATSGSMVNAVSFAYQVA